MQTEPKAPPKSAANGLTKEDLFQDFLRCTQRALEGWEWRFQVEGIADRVFVEGRAEPEAASALRKSNAWKILSDLFEYAVNGIDSSYDEHTSFLVTEGAEVLQLVTTHDRVPSQRWADIVAMADGRFALDNGYYLEIHKLALLANVDVRTVRNAISAGDLESFKKDSGVFIENAHARRWLLGRRGFKATVVRLDEVRPELNQLDTPGHIAAFLAARRQELGKAVGDASAALHASIDKLEAGVFDMPLDVIEPLAGYYQVSRKDLLRCVRRIFFPEELDLLTGGSTAAVSDSGVPTVLTRGADSTGQTDVPDHPNTGAW